VLHLVHDLRSPPRSTALASVGGKPVVELAAANASCTPGSTLCLAHQSDLIEDVGFIDQLQSELKHAMVEHQALVLVQVLRKRLASLTFGELRTLLDNRLGRGLNAVLVRDLVDPSVPAPQSAASKTKPAPKTKSARRPHKRSKKSGTSTSSSAKESAKPAKAKVKSKARANGPTPAREGRPPRVSALTVAGREQYDGALVQYLRDHPGFSKPRDIRAAVGGTKLQFRIAMQRLEEKGQVQRQGTHGTTQYAAKS
jgi:hypothetical protein